MKKIFLLFIALFSGVVMYAQNYSEISSNELPKKAKEWISKNVPNSTLGRMGKSGEKANTVYAVVVKEKDRKTIYVFDNTGNYLERVKNAQEFESKYKNGKPAPAPVNKTIVPAPKPNTDGSSKK